MFVCDKLQYYSTYKKKGVDRSRDYTFQRHDTAQAPGGSRDKLLERLSTARETIEMDIDIRAKAVHRDKTKVATKVSRIEPREREAVPKACHRRVKVARPEVLVDLLAFHRRVHISPDERYCAARYPATLV